MNSLNDRFRGALLGVLVGDALGAPYETWSGADVVADMKRRGGLTLFDYPDPWSKDGVFPAGRPTDDSELTAALAESLLITGGINMEDQHARFKRAVSGESILWDGPAIGFGRNTKQTLAFDTHAASVASDAVPLVPSNGSVMRSAPLALFYHRREHELNTAARASAQVTHRHPVAIEASAFFALVLSAVLAGHEFEDAVIDAYGYGEFMDEIYEPLIEKKLYRPNIPPKFPARGGAVLTLEAAFWAFENASSFKNGIEKVVALGGDTDTYAAVAGALLGARYGESGIPPEWLQGVKGTDRMRRLADKLYERNQHPT